VRTRVVYKHVERIAMDHCNDIGALNKILRAQYGADLTELPPDPRQVCVCAPPLRLTSCALLDSIARASFHRHLFCMLRADKPEMQKEAI
jgi:hypothetical protein